MKNYVELAKKWLADNKSASLEELEANEKAVFYASKIAYKVADVARAIALTDDDDYVEHCKQQVKEAIEKYEELTK